VMWKGPEDIARDIFAASMRSSLEAGRGCPACKLVIALLL
jgi:hypothetical protein